MLDANDSIAVRSAFDEDPIVAEVRATREALDAEVGFDVRRLHEQLKAIEDAERAAGRQIIAAPGRRQPADVAA